MVLPQRTYEFCVLKNLKWVKDLNYLKKYVIQQQRINSFKVSWTKKTTRLLKMRELIKKRYFEIFNKLSQISIDGCRRDKFLQKIKTLTEDVAKA